MRRSNSLDICKMLRLNLYMCGQWTPENVEIKLFRYLQNVETQLFTYVDSGPQKMRRSNSLDICKMLRLNPLHVWTVDPENVEIKLFRICKMWRPTFTYVDSGPQKMWRSNSLDICKMLRPNPLLMWTVDSEMWRSTL
ncbi:hypothetical protein Pyn_15662 [Prunus yedoensis var. nudiflora]|uniref:Uncharacterized protein n=1 Tax=Prunus yedoensis var. nudiflora TaxID=2094558 RepID=A0A314Z3L4_PRUYE|nr:hypothetical protein Pyn_15662 [Prunus yedoensis var. nudiflora]